MIRVEIVGATGYAGAELVRLLSMHPGVTISGVTSGRAAGEKLRDHCPWLSTDLVLKPFDVKSLDADVVFLAQEHGFAYNHAASIIDQGIKVIDLSADFRLRSSAKFREYYGADANYEVSGNHFVQTLADGKQHSLEVVYGLSEWNSDSDYQKVDLISNPGCYPTATLLALMPIIKHGWLNGIPVIDAKSGVSGAGRAKSSVDFVFSERFNSSTAYAMTRHRHIPEIEQLLGQHIRFTPHLLPIARGMEVTIHAPLKAGVSEANLFDAAIEQYRNSPFVKLTSTIPETKQVLGSNRCDLTYRVDAHTGYLVCVSVIDNLGKGAAGQAVQNMNRLFQLPEATGLPIHGIWP